MQTREGGEGGLPGNVYGGAGDAGSVPALDDGTVGNDGDYEKDEDGG